MASWRRQLRCLPADDSTAVEGRALDQGEDGETWLQTQVGNGGPCDPGPQVRAADIEQNLGKCSLFFFNHGQDFAP